MPWLVLTSPQPTMAFPRKGTYAGRVTQELGPARCQSGHELTRTSSFFNTGRCSKCTYVLAFKDFWKCNSCTNYIECSGCSPFDRVRQLQATLKASLLFDPANEKFDGDLT